MERIQREEDEALEKAANAFNDFFDAEPSKWFISYAWTRTYCGTYSVHSGYGNVFFTKAAGGLLTEEDVQKIVDGVKMQHKPKGSKMVKEVGKGDGVKIEVTVLNIVEVAL